jgi:hypothetical protein
LRIGIDTNIAIASPHLPDKKERAQKPKGQMDGVIPRHEHTSECWLDATGLRPPVIWR